MPPGWNQKQDRISILARPKVNHQVVFCRPTVYWVDKIPKEHPRYTVPLLTSRQEELCASKKVDENYRNNRPTSEWPVTQAALKAEVSHRLKELARPRPFTDAWALNRPSCPAVSQAALNAVPTQRIIALARPRNVASTSKKPPRKFIHGPIIGVAKFEELSKPRIYTFDGHNPYKVSKAALQYVPTPRILEISRPVRVRSRAA